MQLLDPETFVQAIYELTRQQGYLSSPYRYIVFDSNEEENNPDERLRHALSVSGRRALTSALSAGLTYRFYLDDWGLTSHTASVDAALYLDEGWLFSLGYRFYTQGSVSHYQTRYEEIPEDGLFTNDKELTTFVSHRADLELGRTFELDESGSQLKAMLLVSPGIALYEEFPLLDSISVLEVSLATEVSL